jgi:hypothetical protein
MENRRHPEKLLPLQKFREMAAGTESWLDRIMKNEKRRAENKDAGRTTQGTDRQNNTRNRPHRVSPVSALQTLREVHEINPLQQMVQLSQVPVGKASAAQATDF